MSLSTDGVWKAGVWATTVWASGVWYESGVAVSVPTFRGIALDLNSRFSSELDGDARMTSTITRRATINAYIEKVSKFASTVISRAARQ